jgi:hypothetical protein
VFPTIVWFVAISTVMTGLAFFLLGGLKLGTGGGCRPVALRGPPTGSDCGAELCGVVSVTVAEKNALSRACSTAQ